MNKTFKEVPKEPTAFITVKKQRQRQNGINIYLHDKTEFEIELYNPTTEKIKAMIELNGVAISSSGIVLKPGQRVFLERFLDVDRKFLYETYTVSLTQGSMEAIQNNGLVKVKFFKQFKPLPYTGGYTWYGPNVQYYNYNSGTPILNGTTFTTNGTGLITNTASFSNEVPRSKRSIKSKKSIETGSVEMGKKSDQEFGSDYDTYCLLETWTREWKILPYSAKEITTEDLVKKCGCGTKMKDNYKFCPNCGKQLIRTKTEIHYTMDNIVSVNGINYLMETYFDTLDNFLKRHENKLIYIKSDSLTSDSLRAIVID
jgi:hypothetical protein